MGKETREERKLRRIKFFDYNLLFIILFLVGFGLLMLYSTSSYMSQAKTGSTFYYVKHQGLITLGGLVLMYIVSRIDYHIWIRLQAWIYVGTLTLCGLVFVPGIGVDYNGSRRWIGFGGYTIQPSELAKIAIIIVLAYLVNRCSNSINDFKVLLKLFLLVSPFILFVSVSNLSTGLILAGITFLMLFVASRKYMQFAGLLALVAAIGVGYVATAEYRRNRILGWLHPESYETGYQTLQGLYAIGSGGLFGKGLGGSVQKLGAVPEPMNDMVFTIICEELGLVGAICVILMFLLMLWRFMVIALNASDLCGSMIAVGALAHISLQVVLNIAVVTNSIPNTGVTLPFISYGGTSVLFLLVEMGMVLSVSRGIKMDTEVKL